MGEAASRLIGSPWFRWIGAASLVIVAIVSLTPASVQPRTPLPGTMEHVLGYALVAGIFTVGMRRTAFPWFVILSLTAFAIGVEVLQLFAPGRKSEAIGALASLAGVFAGAVASYWVRQRAAKAASVGSTRSG
jgi:VanZ family protein